LIVRLALTGIRGAKIIFTATIYCSDFTATRGEKSSAFGAHFSRSENKFTQYATPRPQLTSFFACAAHFCIHSVWRNFVRDVHQLCSLIASDSLVRFTVYIRSSRISAPKVDLPNLPDFHIVVSSPRGLSDENTIREAPR